MKTTNLYIFLLFSVFTVLSAEDGLTSSLMSLKGSLGRLERMLGKEGAVTPEQQKEKIVSSLLYAIKVLFETTLSDFYSSVNDLARRQGIKMGLFNEVIQPASKKKKMKDFLSALPGSLQKINAQFFSESAQLVAQAKSKSISHLNTLLADFGVSREILGDLQADYGKIINEYRFLVLGLLDNASKAIVQTVNEKMAKEVQQIRKKKTATLPEMIQAARTVTKEAKIQQKLEMDVQQQRSTFEQNQSRKFLEKIEAKLKDIFQGLHISQLESLTQEKMAKIKQQLGEYLFPAIRKNDTELIQKLAGIADVHVMEQKREVGGKVYGVTPLMEAAKLGNEIAAGVLLEHTAAVNAQDVNLTTPLMYAAQKASNEVTEKLIEYGADPKLQSITGDTALMKAFKFYPENKREFVKTGKSEEEFNKRFDSLIEKLVAVGSDVNAKDKQDATVLMYAASTGFKKVVSILLKRGAIVASKDKGGRSALWYAEPFPEITQLLKEKE